MDRRLPRAQLRMHVPDASRDVMLGQCMGERRGQMHATVNTVGIRLGA